MGQKGICVGMPLPGSQRKKRIRAFLSGFFIAALLGIAFGYFWAAKSYTRTYELRLEQKEIFINH